MCAGRWGEFRRGIRGWGPVVFLLGWAAVPGARALAQDEAVASRSSPGAVAPTAGVIPAPVPDASGTPQPYGLADRATPAGFFNVALASTFGPSDNAPWRPLSLRTLFTEGWDETWVAEPNDSGDAQQGWINAADGNFYRLSFLSYHFTNHLARGGNGNTGAYTLYTPLSRRLELITNVPFITSQPVFGVGKQGFAGQSPSRTAGHHTSAGFGDVTFTPRVMLIDADDFALNAQVSIQTPTGYRRVGAGQTILTPGLQFWWNFRKGWVVRGGFYAGVGTNRQAGGTTLLSQLALGRTFTPHDVPLLGDLTFYLSANAFNTVSASQTTVTLTPGFRTHLGNDWYALGGLDVPVTGGRPFEEGVILWLMKTF